MELTTVDVTIDTLTGIESFRQHYTHRCCIQYSTRFTNRNAVYASPLFFLLFARVNMLICYRPVALVDKARGFFKWQRLTEIIVTLHSLGNIFAYLCSEVMAGSAHYPYVNMT